MARIPPRTIALKDCRTVLLRCAEPADVPALWNLFDDLDATSEFQVDPPGGPRLPADQRAARIAELAEADGSLMVVAMSGEVMVGELSFSAHKPARMAHHGHFGIGIRSTWRGVGLGETMVRLLIDWASAHPKLEKVCLGVFAENEPAIALYRKLGFTEECRRRKEFKMGPGRYIDDIQMSLWVKPPEQAPNPL